MRFIKIYFYTPYPQIKTVVFISSIRPKGIKGPNKELRGYREVYIGMVVSLCQRGMVLAN